MDSWRRLILGMSGLLVACGGIADISGTLGTGGASAGEGGSPGVATGAGPSVSTGASPSQLPGTGGVTSGGPVTEQEYRTVCDSLCESIVACGLQQAAECSTDCTQTYFVAGPCAEATYEVLTCTDGALQASSRCDVETVMATQCWRQQLALLRCSEQLNPEPEPGTYPDPDAEPFSCPSSGTASSDGSCSISFDCPSGRHSTRCRPAADGSMACTCSVAGKEWPAEPGVPAGNASCELAAATCFSL